MIQSAVHPWSASTLKTFALMVAIVAGMAMFSGGVAEATHGGTIACDPSTGNCYEFVTASLSWQDAKTDAETRAHNGQQGHLVTLTTQAENDFVHANVTRIGNTWMGASQPTPSDPAADGWVWVTGETWSYSNWNTPDEPNDAFGGEDALMFWGTNGKWNDISSAGLYSYVVEYDGPRTYTWADWLTSTSTAPPFHATGSIDIGSTAITVTYDNPQGVNSFDSGSGIDYWTNYSANIRDAATSPYTSDAVANIPTGSDMIRLQYAGSQTLTFKDSSNDPIDVANPVFAFVSLNLNGYGFDRDFDILSTGGSGNDCGFFDSTPGCSASTKEVKVIDGVTEYWLVGTGEPHGTIRFRGSFSTLNWESLGNETWNGFNVGIAGLASDLPDFDGDTISDDVDTSPTDKCLPDPSALACDADLVLTKTASPTIALVNQTLTYTLTATNLGPEPATTVTVTDTLPSGVVYVSNDSGCTEVSGTVTCTVASMANAAVETFNIVVTAPSSFGSLSNTATITAVQRDSVSGNNSVTLNTSVGSPAGVPGLTTWGMGILALMLGAAAFFMRRRRATAF